MAVIISFPGCIKTPKSLLDRARDHITRLGMNCGRNKPDSKNDPGINTNLLLTTFSASLRALHLRSFSQKVKFETFSRRKSNTHPSWMGQPTILVNQEVVYYILSGTPRSTQKYFWSNLRVEFSGENHLLLIWGKMPNQISWITKNLGSGFNSDLFKKKICPNRTCLDCFR